MAKFYYGGQAVMEGVMMRGRTSAAVAGRRSDGSLYIYEEGLNPRLYQSTLFRLPFLRGMLLLWEMLILGTRMMTLATNISIGAIDPDALMEQRFSQQHNSPTSTGEEKDNTQEKERTSLGGAQLAITLLISLSFAIAIFFVGPLLLTNLLSRQIGQGLLNLAIEGAIRLALLLGYLLLIGRIPDIQRIFGYHGAEHKAINAMEYGDPLDVAHVRQASRVHTRCGTGFLLLVMVVSIFIFALVNPASFLLKIVSRILLVPVVAGISYELMRVGAANYRYRFVRWLLAPGLALQNLTTREPDDGMIQCAIAALQRVMQRDGQSETEALPHAETTLPPLAVSH